MSTSTLPSPAELQQSLGTGGLAPRTRHWWILGGVVLAGAALVLLTCTLRRAKNQIVYESAPVVRGDLRVTVRSTGSLQAVTSVEVGSEVSGRVLKILVDVNDEVKKGQILAEIDPEQSSSSLEQARAQLVGAQAAITLAEATTNESARILARNQNLAKEGILSRADLDASLSTKERADASLHSAQENAKVAQAVVAMAGSKLQKSTIRAPIDGVVLARLVEPGQTVTAGFQTPVLFKLAQDLRKMRLNVDIDEADVSRVHSGQAAEFTVESYPGRNFPSKVVSLQLEPKVSQNVVTYQAVLTAENAELALFPGMTCTATIQAETKQAVLVVPNAALRFTPPASASGFPKEGGTLSDGKHRVWILKNNKPEPIEVKLGATDGRNTEILEGSLQEGMKVLMDAKEPS
jgi:HlyD family secretion protein